LCGVETSTLRKVDKLYLGSTEMWLWRRMEKIIWTDYVRNEEVLHRVKEERYILSTIKRRKTNWFGHIVCKNCLFKHISEGKRGKNRSDGKTRKKTEAITG
jgi:hypothetical protein